MSPKSGPHHLAGYCPETLASQETTSRASGAITETTSTTLENAPARPRPRTTRRDKVLAACWYLVHDVGKELDAIMREKVHRLVEARGFQRTILLVIVVNAVTLGAQTSQEVSDRTWGLLAHLDRAAVALFALELLLKLYAYRLAFFRDPWNCFDFLVVSVSLVPVAGAFSVMRTLRVLRMLRLISVVPSMRRVVATLLAAIPGVSSIICLLALVVYVAAVMATTLFGEVAPRYFGGLGRSLWTLFQVMTGENWPSVADAVMAERPMAWIFFLIYILVSSFVVLNLFLAVVVNAMDTVRLGEANATAAANARAGGEPAPEESSVRGELAALREEIAALRRLLGGTDPDLGAGGDRPSDHPGASSGAVRQRSRTPPEPDLAD